MTEIKEKYISLSYCRLDGNPVCGHNDTQFLCLDKEEENKQEIIKVTNEEEEDITNKISKDLYPQRTDFCAPQSPRVQIRKVYDNFLDNQPRFHHISLYETKLRFYLVGSFKDNSTVNEFKFLISILTIFVIFSSKF